MNQTLINQYNALGNLIANVNRYYLPRLRLTDAVDPRHDGLRVIFNRSAEVTPKSSLRRCLKKTVADFVGAFHAEETAICANGETYKRKVLNEKNINADSLRAAFAKIQVVMPAVMLRFEGADKEDLASLTEDARKLIGPGL